MPLSFTTTGLVKVSQLTLAKLLSWYNIQSRDLYGLVVFYFRVNCALKTFPQQKNLCGVRSIVLLHHQGNFYVLQLPDNYVTFLIFFNKDVASDEKSISVSQNNPIQSSEHYILHIYFFCSLLKARKILNVPGHCAGCDRLSDRKHSLQSTKLRQKKNFTRMAGPCHCYFILVFFLRLL